MPRIKPWEWKCDGAQFAPAFDRRVAATAGRPISWVSAETPSPIVANLATLSLILASIHRALWGISLKSRGFLWYWDGKPRMVLLTCSGHSLSSHPANQSEQTFKAPVSSLEMNCVCVKPGVGGHLLNGSYLLWLQLLIWYFYLSLVVGNRSNKDKNQTKSLCSPIEPKQFSVTSHNV